MASLVGACNRRCARYGAAFCVHGDDITTDEHGNDTYHIVKAAGRYKECKRTAGVSTTDLAGRMLLQHKPVTTKDDEVLEKAAEAEQSPWTGQSQFLCVSTKLYPSCA